MIPGNNQTNREIEKILEQALELKDKGYSVSRILDMFPLHQEELKEMLEIVAALDKYKEELVPSRDLLSSMVSRALNAAQDVTENPDARFSYRGVIKGRPSFISLISQAFKIKLAIPVAIIVIAFILAGYRFDVFDPKKESIVKQEQGQNIDDVIAALMKDLPEESDALIDEESDDAVLASFDSNDINELDQIYDEKKF